MYTGMIRFGGFHMKYIISLLGLAMLSGSTMAYDEQRNTVQQGYQQNTGYQQQIDHNSPEGTEGEMAQQRGGPGEPQEGRDGTMYPSNNDQDEDPE
jgi:hypothetical protein